MQLMTLVAVLNLAGILNAPLPQSAEVTTVANVDLDRYIGEWYEIARLPNNFQDKCVGDVKATYMKRPDGRLDVVNECRKKDGKTNVARAVARIVDASTNSKLEVRFVPAFLSFLPSVWGDYWIIGLADDYSWATVGSPDRKYLWILSRTAEMSEADYTDAVGRATANGFDVSKLVRTNQGM